MKRAKYETEIQVDVSYRGDKGEQYELYHNKKGLPIADDFVTVRVHGEFIPRSFHNPPEYPEVDIIQVETTTETGESALVEDLGKWGSKKLRDDLIEFALHRAMDEMAEQQEREERM